MEESANRVQVWKKDYRGPRSISTARRPALRSLGKNVTVLHAVTLWNIVPTTEDMFQTLDQTAIEKFWSEPTLMPVMVDSVRYTTKPTNEDTRRISSRIMGRSQRVTHTGLAELVMAGHTVIPAALDRGIDPSTGKPYGTPRAAVLREKRLWMLDIDSKQEGLTVSSILRSLLDFGIQPFLIYETLSSTDAIPRFRVCIQSTESVEDPTLQLRISMGLIQALTGALPDMDASCVNHNRLFYPARRIAWMASRMITGIERLLELAVEMEVLQQPAVSTTSAPSQVSAIQIPAVGNRSMAQVSDVTIYTTPHVEAIRRGDVAGLRSLILAAIPFEETLNSRSLLSRFNVYSRGQVSAIPQAMSQRIPFMCSFPLGILLGVPDDGSQFRCILHNDKTASAHVRQVPDGRYQGQYQYKCFGQCVSSLALSALDIVEEIQGKGTYRAFKFLESLFGIGDSDWMRQKKDELDVYTEYISGGSLESRYPLLHQEMANSNTLPIWRLHLQQARRNLVDRTGTGCDDLIYFGSLRSASSELIELAKGVGIVPKGYSVPSVAKKTDYLTHLHLLDKLMDAEIPAPLLHEAKRYQEEAGNRYRTNFYRIPSFDKFLFTRAETIIQSDKERGFRRGAGFGRSVELVLNGKAEADRTRPQDLERGIVRQAEEFYTCYHTAAAAIMSFREWTTEAEILSSLTGYGDRQLSELSRLWMPKLLADNGMQHVQLTKINRAQYGIPDSVHYGSKIIISID